ncbi:hypothetical protein [Bacillus thuringiensis]|uniref:hypothetical protein n=1 Tax=Bacillus cereus group TaxID=86661 RepID=UPI00078747EC|nr:hypothetical protein [Bacillus thuringiensis]AMR84345.1 hypothetical protein A3L20_10050 [Bacillus thuringiensis]MBG9636065.1 hypothetical protein [Bacillus thuringiensis]MBG9675423.1 hypothetical protein [Bacillus thuringiensis]MDR5024622.1 hypothetical protein [Bacillus thuringiensis]MEC3296125.1 hypothetical protein [Bacillus thuringiensis]
MFNKFKFNNGDKVRNIYDQKEGTVIRRFQTIQNYVTGPCRVINMVEWRLDENTMRTSPETCLKRMEGY